MPAADIAGVYGARPEHCARGEYGLLVMEAPEGDQSDRERVAGGYGTTGSPVEMEAMEMEEEYRQRAPPTRSQKEWEGGRTLTSSACFLRA